MTLVIQGSTTGFLLRVSQHVNANAEGEPLSQVSRRASAGMVLDCQLQP